MENDQQQLLAYAILDTAMQPNNKESYVACGIQVYLLTLMDGAMLFDAKSTISHCPPSLVTRQ